MAKKKNKTTKKRTLKAATDTVLRRVAVTKLDCEVIQIKNSGPPKTLSIENSLQLNQDIATLIECHVFSQVTARYEGESDAALRLGFTFVATYSANKMLTERQLAVFGETKCVFDVWPFVRELTQSTVARMGLPTVMLPPFESFGARQWNKKKQAKRNKMPKKKPARKK